jgi:hypothetical protein
MIVDRRKQSPPLRSLFSPIVDPTVRYRVVIVMHPQLLAGVASSATMLFCRPITIIVFPAIRGLKP